MSPDEGRTAAHASSSARSSARRRSSSAPVIVGFWVLCAIFGERARRRIRYASDLLNDLAAPSADHWFGTDRLGRDVFSRVIVGARDILIMAPLATLLATVLGTALGLVTGYFRGAVDDVLIRVIDAFLALPVVIVGLLAIVALGPSQAHADRRRGRRSSRRSSPARVRAAVLVGARARVRRGGAAAQRAHALRAVRRDPAERLGPVMVEFTVRLGYAIFAIATLTFLGFGIQPPAPDWGLQIFEHYGLIIGGFWWTVLFPALAITSLVVGVNLLADGVTQAFER